jgi:hypothetical protein
MICKLTCPHCEFENEIGHDGLGSAVVCSRCQQNFRFQLPTLPIENSPPTDPVPTSSKLSDSRTNVPRLGTFLSRALILLLILVLAVAATAVLASGNTSLKSLATAGVFSLGIWVYLAVALLSLTVVAFWLVFPLLVYFQLRKIVELIEAHSDRS